MPYRKHALFAAIAALATQVAACTNQQEGLLIRRAPQWQSQDDGNVTVGTCAVDPNNTATLNHGVLDISFGTPYMAPLEVENNMLSIDAESSPNGINDGEIRLSEAEVALAIPQAADAIDGLAAQDEALVNFKTPVQSISLEPGQSSGMLLEIVPSATSQALAGALGGDLASGGKVRLVATIVVRGYRAVDGGNRNEVESRPFDFPVDLCMGCLLDCSMCAPGECTTMGPMSGGVCGNAQDFAVFPQSCSAGTGG